jgi:lactose/L-arabinose transport system substrate-binding protein
LGGEKIWQKFADWLSMVPSVNFGTFTNEVDSAVAAQLPALGKGGDVDAALKAIEAQAKSSMQ